MKRSLAAVTLHQPDKDRALKTRPHFHGAFRSPHSSLMQEHERRSGTLTKPSPEYSVEALNTNYLEAGRGKV